MIKIILAVFPLLLQAYAQTTPYAQYILTPRSRTLLPVSVHNVSGAVQNPETLTASNGAAVFPGASFVTYDMGKNVAGVVSFNVTSGSGPVFITFAESSLFVNYEASDGSQDYGLDTPLVFDVSSGSQYTAEKKYQRGGFRYLTVFNNGTEDVELGSLSVYYTSSPQLSESELGSYKGYFHCEDEQLTRVWYAGAYTNELCTIESTAGDALVHLGQPISNLNTWWNNYTITNGSSALVDGAKRDRLVWPGDMSVALPSMIVSTYDTYTIENALNSLLILQQASGALPYAGVPFATTVGTFSFTYHLYSLIAIHNHYLYTGNLAYLQQNWPVFKKGLTYSLSFVDTTGLAYVTSSADWLRFYMGAHNIEANAILYHTINLGLELAQIINDGTDVSNWTSTAATIKQSAQRLWDPSANLYRDNDTQPLTSLHPQDGNCWAVISNITTSPEQNVNISNALAARWSPYGAPAPEAGSTTVSPFISSFELQAHYIAGQPASAVKLMSFMWGDYMLDDPRMTNSTFIEGYATDGSVHYQPYVEDARISLAHGWATGPTSALSFYAAGIQMVSAGGKTWRIAPSPGGLTSIDAGYQTTVGSFTSKVTTDASGNLTIDFGTPGGTTGEISIENPDQPSVMTIHNTDPGHADVTVNIPGGGGGRVVVNGIPGGNYHVTIVAAGQDSDL